MWWKNVRLMALLVVVAVFLIYLFVGFGCGLPGKLQDSRGMGSCANGSQGGRDALAVTSHDYSDTKFPVFWQTARRSLEGHAGVWWARRAVNTSSLARSSGAATQV